MCLGFAWVDRVCRGTSFDACYGSRFASTCNWDSFAPTCNYFAITHGYPFAGFAFHTCCDFSPWSTT